MSATDPGVTQSILAGRDDGVNGNCLQAAVATVLELPLDAVPHFSQFVWWDMALDLWLRGRGMTLRRTYGETIPDELCILGGKSPRGVDHVVISKHGQIVWDPHPSRAGLTIIEDAIFFDRWPNDEHLCWVCHAAEVDASQEPAAVSGERVDQ